MKHASQKPFSKTFPPIQSELNGHAPTPVLKKGFCFAFHVHHGFSLIEIIVSVAALAFVLSAGWFSFASYAARQELHSASARVAALIAEARSKTLAGEHSSAYGVHFESDRAVLYRAPTYTAGSADNKTELMPRRIIISAISFSGNALVFQRLTGTPTAAGSVTLSVIGDASVAKTVSVGLTGTIEGE